MDALLIKHGLQSIVNPLGNGLAFLGVFFLIAASIRIWMLTKELGAGHITLRWRFLNAYIVFFVLGYLVYIALFWNRQHWYGLFISVILFFGSIFVWVVSFLAQETVLDMQRVVLLEHENVTDTLTGLYNRRFLDQRITTEYRRACRYRYPISVLMLDIDHFKQINDTHGHQAGDLALRFVSGLILNAIRDPDIAARYGGEEFAIISPHIRLRDAAELAERIRKHIELHELSLAGSRQNRQIIRITVSIGVAELSPGISSAEQLIKCADQALYYAKESGRNRVARYYPDLADPFVSADTAGQES